MNNIDNEISKALSKKTENINAPDILDSIKNELENKENDIMKRFKFTPKVLVAAIALTVILATGVIGAGKIAGVRSGSSHSDDIKHFPTLEEVEDIVDYSPKFVESLGTHKYKFANPADSENYDDNGNVLNKYKDISFWYETDKEGAILTLNTHPSFEGTGADKDHSEAIDYKGITLYYSSCTYKAVPPDYVATDEDKKLEEKGELMIGYGSDKVEEKKTQSIVWDEDGITYDILDMGEEIDKTELIEMAKQVIDVR